MVIEVLYPEICNLSGELMNVRYLCQCCPDAMVIETDLKTIPAFLSRKVDLVYIGSTTERGLQMVVDALRPVLHQVEEKIAAGQFMLVTGNTLDAFGETVDSDEGLHIDGLGIFKTHARYQMMRRHNSLFLGRFMDMEIVGFKSLFGLTYDAPETEGLFETMLGVGRNAETKLEGFRRNNLMATYVTGPILVNNPPFTQYLLKQLGESGALAHKQAAEDAYEQRKKELHGLL